LAARVATVAPSYIKQYWAAECIRAKYMESASENIRILRAYDDSGNEIDFKVVLSEDIISQ